MTNTTDIDISAPTEADYTLDADGARWDPDAAPVLTPAPGETYRYNTVPFASGNEAEYFWRRLDALGLDAEYLYHDGDWSHHVIVRSEIAP